MKVISPKRLLQSVFPTVRNGSIFNASSLDLQFARTKTLDPRVTFTRASSGTYVDSQGVIRTATTNLLLRSEEFDNASWTVVGTVGVTANADTAPNGATSAERITFAAAGYIRQFVGTVIPGATYTVSLWVKKPATGGASAIRIASNNVNAWNTGFSQKFTLTSQWQRIAATGTLVSSNASAYVIFGTKTEADANDADCVGDVLVWGAQLEQSSTVGEYIPTTSTINSAPRFDHNPTTGESLGLLVEEQRTNLVVQSEDFGTTWTTTGLLAFGSGSTLNATTAPTGVSTADLITEDTSNGNHRIATAAISWAGNTQYTFSCFVKANGRSNISLLLGTAGNWVNSSREAQFNLSTGTVSYTSGTPVTASITAFSNGWYRLTMTATTVAAPSASSVFIQMMDSTPLSSYTGNGTSGVFLFGGMLEAGSFPTSYIPTTTAAVTRSADVASITGSNFSSWYRQDEGTVFAETQLQSAAARTVAGFDVNDNSTNNRIVFRALTSSVADQVVIRSGGATVFSQANINPAPTTASRKTSVGYKANDFMYTALGAAGYTGTSGAVPASVTQMLIGYEQGPLGYLGGTIRRLTYWPQRLSNSTLQQITQ